MKDVACPQCGQRMPDSYTRCPVCGTAIDKQPQQSLNTSQRRYIVWFALLTLFCIVVALLLPR